MEKFKMFYEDMPFVIHGLKRERRSFLNALRDNNHILVYHKMMKRSIVVYRPGKFNHDLLRPRFPVSR